ncbi:MAG: hypothetical protein K2M08_07855 [Anaeroplasmataceae bacterium]|nr:hypothetical protein [Anaeroplasmataceae bacterium]
MKKRKENKRICPSEFIKDMTVGFLYALPIICLVLSAFRVGLSEKDLYVEYTSLFNFNLIYDTFIQILSKFGVAVGGTNLYICLSVFSWFVFVGLMDCVYDVFDFLISMFQSFIHKGY